MTAVGHGNIIIIITNIIFSLIPLQYKGGGDTIHRRDRFSKRGPESIDCCSICTVKRQ